MSEIESAPPARLVERLRAGLDERERVAQEAEPGPWRLVQNPTSGDLRIVADDDGVVVDHGGQAADHLSGRQASGTGVGRPVRQPAGCVA